MQGGPSLDRDQISPKVYDSMIVPGALGLGRGAGAGQRSGRTAAPRWLNKLAVRQELRGGYGYGSMIVPRANSQFQGPRDCGVRAGGKACGKKKKAVVGLGFAHVYAIPVGRYPSSRDMFQGPRDWGNACRRLAE